MGNVPPLRSIPRTDLDPKKSNNVNSARLYSAWTCEQEMGMNYAERLERAETTEDLINTATAFKKVAQVLKFSSGGARIGEQIYMTQRMMDLKSEFTDKSEEFKDLGGDLVDFGKVTGLKIGNVFKVAEEFYKSASAVQLNATTVRGDAHTVATQKQLVASDAYAKFDTAIGLRDRANTMKVEAKYALDNAYKTVWPKGQASYFIGIAKTNYTNANKYYGEKNQQALQAQGVAESARADYLSAIASENIAIDQLNSANEQLYTSAQNYTDAKAQVDAYNLEVAKKLKKFNKSKEELQGIMREVKNEQVSSNQRLALYATGGRAGAISDAIGDAINHAVAGQGCRAIASLAKGGLQPMTELGFQEASPYLPLANSAIDAVAYAGDTGDVETALWNFGDTVLGIGLMMQNIQDIENFYLALEDDDYETAMSLAGRSLVGSWNVGVQNTGTAVALATGIPFAKTAIGISGKIASNIIKTPIALGLTIATLDKLNVPADKMAGASSLTLVGALGNGLGEVLSEIDGGRFLAWWKPMILNEIADVLEGSGLATEQGKVVLGYDDFGLGTIFFFADPKKEVTDPNLREVGANNMGLGGVQDAWYKTTGARQYNWWLSMGYDACGGELKPCLPDYNSDVNKSMQDQEAHNAFMLDCSKKQNAWLSPFDITDWEGATRCGIVYNEIGLWAMNGCNFANTPIKSLTNLKDRLKPIDFSDINLRSGDQVDRSFGGDAVVPK